MLLKKIDKNQNWLDVTELCSYFFFINGKGRQGYFDNLYINIEKREQLNLPKSHFCSVVSYLAYLVYVDAFILCDDYQQSSFVCCTTDDNTTTRQPKTSYFSFCNQRVMNYNRGQGGVPPFVINFGDIWTTPSPCQQYWKLM